MLSVLPEAASSSADAVSGVSAAEKSLGAPPHNHQYSKQSGFGRTVAYTPAKSVKMPQEVSDIKQFIEICRRKDASCMFYPPAYSTLLLREEGEERRANPKRIL